jgi:hypothetical protein
VSATLPVAATTVRSTGSAVGAACVLAILADVER